MTLQTRLSKLEATVSPDDNRPWLRVIGHSEEGCEAKRRALIDAGDAVESDNFVFRILVSPEAATCETGTDDLADWKLRSPLKANPS
jgi:hypothetical protein